MALRSSCLVQRMDGNDETYKGDDAGRDGSDCRNNVYIVNTNIV